ncbi:MAG: 23S rRNA (uracil(1939)-C(5))-methyltransferase RlmD [Spirochaetales bacterium]|nr:23S rRNA (uracil(1939)-C(5))-methyltransferase RlmD [Spirochaetales bacterium]
MESDLAPGALTECTLTSLEYGGHAGVKHHGAMLAVPRGVPGDTVRVRVKKLRKGYGSAEIEEIVSASPDRVEADCPAFRAGCGGCQWLQVAYPTQLAWKQKMFVKAMTKVLGVRPDVRPVAPMREPHAFRNKLSLVADGQGRFGFMKENSKSIVYFDQCPMELPRLQRLYRKLVHRSFPASVEQIHARGTRTASSLVMYAEKPSAALHGLARRLEREIPGLSSIAVRTRNGVRLLAGIPFLTQRVGRLDFFIPPDSFFQTNYFQALTLLEIARRLLELTSSETFVDLYCGVGFFALDGAAQARRVIGIEGNRSSVEAARLSAKLNKITNTEFWPASAADGLAELAPGEVDALLLDPPRRGCDESVLRAVARLRPSRIAYVSCLPETLARDCARLIDMGYLLGEIAPVDMFPHTYHTEAVVKLVAR